ncbi:MAG TPA: hypothetical protein VMJ10_13140 [Kofleriaceae bacterium]|nr:hypothetical protein [Kofleriaceae bacterium]
MRSIAWVVLGIALAACSGDSPTGTPMCSGSLYDPCATEHDCQNTTQMACMPFDDAFEACTQSCTKDSDCPKQSDGKAVTCNPQMLCQPEAANVCTMP